MAQQQKCYPLKNNQWVAKETDALNCKSTHCVFHCVFHPVSMMLRFAVVAFLLVNSGCSDGRKKTAGAIDSSSDTWQKAADSGSISVGEDSDTEFDAVDTDEVTVGDDTETDSTEDSLLSQVTPLEGGVATSLRNAMGFLYSGDNPIQKGLNDSILDGTRISVLRGIVLNRDNQPLPRVVVSVHGHPEYGYTLTRNNGQFDMVVNGGQMMTVNYGKDGFLSSQRTTRVVPQEFEWLPDVVMIPKDKKATVVAINSDVIQVVQGTQTDDRWGTRTSTLFVPPATTATAVLPDGTEMALESLTMRSTEYTIGENGPETMPSSMSAAVGYTYAVDLSIDEADALGAKGVNFNQPIPYYVENFLGFPAGTIVPLGYYDQSLAEWIPDESGVVIDLVKDEIYDIGIDVNGDGAGESAYTLEEMGFTEDERAQLANLYKPGQSLWRVMVPHFSTWDCNWPFSAPEGAEAPLLALSNLLSGDSSCAIPGSIIFPDTQVLGESIPVVGTGYQMHYSFGNGCHFHVLNNLLT